MCTTITTRFTFDGFEGDFDALPLRSEILYGAVPAHPITGDFEHAVSVAFGSDDVAARWRVEAIRWRNANPGAPLDLRAIANLVATHPHMLRAREVSS